MLYIVFSRSRNDSGNFVNDVHYNGVSKTDAINRFTAILNTSFDITAAAKTVYFTGFDTSLAFVKDIKKLAAVDISAAQFSTIMQNLGFATCANVLTVSGYKPQINIEQYCEECECISTKVRKNAFGNYLCADCWTKYLTQEAGLVEYYINISNGSASKHSFSDVDLTAIESAWAKQKNKLGKSDAEVSLIEANYTRMISQ